MSLRFEDPVALALLAAIPLMALWQWWRRGRTPALALATLDAAPASITWRTRLQPLLPALRLAAIALAIVALARPQGSRAAGEEVTEGIDIALTLDTSSSMQTPDQDGRQRLDVAQDALAGFIEGRPDDRMALVIFRAQALTLSPLTLDHGALAEFVAQASDVELEDGTAIGLAVGEALNLLRDADAESRVIILLTDGENNQRLVDPLAAARLAQAVGVRLYAIGVVDPDVQPGSVQQRKLNVDETALRHMAELTGGLYYRATGEETLRAIYDQIGELETSRLTRERAGSYTDLAPWVIAAAVLAVVAELALTAGALRRFP